MRFHIYDVLIPFIKFNIRTDREYCKTIALISKEFRRLFGTFSADFAEAQRSCHEKITKGIRRFGGAIRFDLNDFTHEMAKNGDREYIQFKAEELHMIPRIMLMKFENSEDMQPEEEKVRKFGVVASIIWEMDSEYYMGSTGPRKIMWREKQGFFSTTSGSQIHIVNKWTHEASRVNWMVKLKRFIGNVYAREEPHKMAWSLEIFQTWTVKDYPVRVIMRSMQKWRNREMEKWREPYFIGHECLREKVKMSNGHWEFREPEAVDPSDH